MLLRPSLMLNCPCYFVSMLQEGLSDVYLLLQHSKTKLHGLSPRANYTDRATAVCRLSDCQLLRIEGATWSA
jgi:hypothetical protein